MELELTIALALTLALLVVVVMVVVVVVVIVRGACHWKVRWKAIRTTKPSDGSSNGLPDGPLNGSNNEKWFDRRVRQMLVLFVIVAFVVQPMS